MIGCKDALNFTSYCGFCYRNGREWQGLGARDACVNLARIRSKKKKLSACVEGRELKGIPQSLHTTIGWSTGPASGDLFPASRAGSLQVAHGSIHLAAGRCTVLMRRANVSVLRSIALSAPYNFISFGAALALKSRAAMDSLRITDPHYLL